MRLGDIIDQLHDNHGLADTGAAKQADLAALGVRRQQVDDLDAGFQDFRFRRLIDEIRCRGMNRHGFFRLHRAAFVDRLADHIDNAPQHFRSDRHLDTGARVGDLLAAHQAFGGVHSDTAHGAFAQMLSHFQHQPVAVVIGLQRVQNRRQFAVEGDIDDSAHNLRNAAVATCTGHGRTPVELEFSLSCCEALPSTRLDGLGAGDDFDQLSGDLGLAGAVVVEGQLVDHIAGVARGAVHRRHARALLARRALEERAEHLNR